MNPNKTVIVILTILLSTTGIFAGNPDSVKSEVWLTKADRSELLKKQDASLTFTRTNRGWGKTIIVDDRQQFQDIDGFGFALTGGSAGLIIGMSPEKRKQLLDELFGRHDNSIRISYIRLTVGASDLNSFVFSYNDLPEGETDYNLKKFDLAQDKYDVIPVMQEILTINPDIKIMASPWSAPAWMKENCNVRGGHLKKECYPAYAQYFVKYIKAMKENGITIDALTIQNEPLNSRNTPSMPWYLDEQREFLRDHLIPAFKESGITTRLVLFDHNCDRIDYSLALLDDPVISEFADGSGFHHYRGDLGAMSKVHLARPDKNLYFTEQMITEKPGSPVIEIAGRVKRMIIDVNRNWSRNVILWNLAADPLNDPHTDNGGCSMCQGALTIDGDEVNRNIAYYTIAHASKFVPDGSVRIFSTGTGVQTVDLTEDEERPGLIRATVIEDTQVLPNVAFKTPDGKTVLIVVNNTFDYTQFNIQYNGFYTHTGLHPGSAATFVW